MAFTASEEIRITAIETLLNSLQTAVTNLVSKAQFRQLLLLRQTEIEELQTRVTALETQVQALQTRL